MGIDDLYKTTPIEEHGNIAVGNTFVTLKKTKGTVIYPRKIGTDTLESAVESAPETA